MVSLQAQRDPREPGVTVVDSGHAASVISPRVGLRSRASKIETTSRNQASCYSTSVPYSLIHTGMPTVCIASRVTASWVLLRTG